MALRKALSQRLFNITRFSSRHPRDSRMSSPVVRSLTPPDRRKMDVSPGPGDGVTLRRFLHKRTIFSSAAVAPDVRAMPVGGDLIGKLKEINDASRDRIGLQEIARPEKAFPELTVEETRKLLRVAQMEVVKSRLRETDESWVSYSEFVQICGEVCGDPKQGSWIAKVLDESGNVIVLGDSVCLRPEEVAKSMEGLLPHPVSAAAPKDLEDPRRKELEELEASRASIEEKARLLVRRELWAGLGFLVVQTVGFMRLTFWELSWDVMEPICYYVTSIYFMAGYTFFLRTTREPSFEGFYQSRFAAKRNMLMKRHGFDADRYNELKKLLEHDIKPNQTPQLTMIG